MVQGTPSYGCEADKGSMHPLKSSSPQFILFLTSFHDLPPSSSQTETHIASSSVSEAVSSYSKLSALCSLLEPSKCSHLKRFAAAARQHWRDKLREKLSR